MRDLSEDGQKIPDWPKVTLKTKKPAPTDVAFTGADYVEYHKPLLGSWNITVEEGGKVHTGTASWQLAANGTCYLVSLQADGLPAIQAVMGYDAAAKKWIHAGFDTADRDGYQRGLRQCHSQQLPFLQTALRKFAWRSICGLTCA